MKQKQFTFLNKHTEQPLRYVGGELNSIVKENCPASMLLAFPDVYEIGMSHFGSRILYEKINFNTPYAMERVYMPWRDVYDELRTKSIKLCSLESGKGFSEFDAVGFSLQHEMCFTNVLTMLDLGGVELLAEKRKKGPLVVAGGGAAFNPAPMKQFIDVFAIGEGEDLVVEIMNVLAKTKDRNEQLKQMSKIDGLYVPSIHGEAHVVNKRLVKDLNDSLTIEHPLVPYMQLIHDRITYELQRGCNRGCRFCQAGMIYRPVRQKRPTSILNNIEKDIRTTGYREVGFLSLNACDYPPLPSVIEALQKYFHGRGIYISLPSLRVESISGSFMNVLSLLPKSGFTIAPEAGSPRLRSVINKNISDEEILRTVRTASELGWSSIKAYFMLGLPTETDEDIDILIDLVYRMNKEIKGNKTRLIVSFSNFVPKAHTPFQWERQISADEFEKKLSKLKGSIRDRRISLKWNDPRMSEVEGLFSRGDSRLGNVIYSAYKKGELFSAWGGVFDHSKWVGALKDNDLEFSEFLRERKLDEKLPWSNIGTGISLEWLKEERKKAYEMKDTTHCTFGDCSNCGVCSFYGASNKTAENIDVKDIDLGQPDVKAALNNDKKYRLRCLYKKTGRFIWMGHFDLMSAVEKALLRAKIPVTVSKGFKPTLHLSFSPPVGMGIESKAELVDILMYEHVDAAELLSRINKQLPQELWFTKADHISMSEPSLNQGIESVSWRAYVEGQTNNVSSPFNPDVNIEVQRKGEKRVEKLSDYLAGLVFSDSDGGLIMDFEILFRNGKTLKPTEILKAVFPDVEENRFILVRKEVVLNGVHFSN
jgi:radical SAM family uncharacterized protein/radical SAM-linked protein